MKKLLQRLWKTDEMAFDDTPSSVKGRFQFYYPSGTNNSLQLEYEAVNAEKMFENNQKWINASYQQRWEGVRKAYE